MDQEGEREDSLCETQGRGGFGIDGLDRKQTQVQQNGLRDGETHV